MDGAAVITTTQANWTPLAARPQGWNVRRIERSGREARYLTWDPNRVRCTVFLSRPPSPIAAAMASAGYTELDTGDQLDSARVWTEVLTPTIDPT